MIRAEINRSNHIRAYISLACIGLIWVIPFINPFFLAPVSSFVSEWFAAALLTLALCGLIYQFKNESIKIPLVGLSYFFLIFYLICQVWQYEMSYPERAWIYIAYLILAFLAMLLAIFIRDTIGLGKTCHLLSRLFISGAFISSILGLIQFFDTFGLTKLLIVRDEPSQYIYGNTEQQNHFGQHVFIGLISLIYLKSHTDRRFLFYSLTLLFLFTLSLCGSRTVLLYFVSSIIFYLLLCFFKNKKLLTTTKLIIGTFLIFVFIQAAFIYSNKFYKSNSNYPTSTERILDEFKTENSESTKISGVKQRLVLLESAFEIFKIKPVFGHGPDTFAYQNFNAKKSKHWIYTIHSHNLILEILVCFGLFGFIVLFLIFISWFRTLKFSDSSIDYENFYLLNILLVIFIHSLVELPLWYLYFLIIFSFCLGLTENRYLEFRTNRLLGNFFSIFLLLLASYLYLSAWQYSRLSDSVLAGLENKVTDMNQDIFSPDSNFILKPWHDSLELSISNYKTEEIDKKINLAEKLYQWRPTSYITLKYSIYLAISGEQEQAEAVIAKLLSAYPNKKTRFKDFLMEIHRKTDNEAVLELISIFEKHIQN